MKGPFMVIFLDYFGFEHAYAVCAQSSEEAIKKVETMYIYPVREVVDAYFDYDLIRDGYFLEGEIERSELYA